MAEWEGGVNAQMDKNTRSQENAYSHTPTTLSTITTPATTSTTTITHINTHHHTQSLTEDERARSHLRTQTLAEEERVSAHQRTHSLAEEERESEQESESVSAGVTRTGWGGSEMGGESESGHASLRSDDEIKRVSLISSVCRMEKPSTSPSASARIALTAIPPPRKVASWQKTQEGPTRPRRSNRSTSITARSEH